MCWMGIWSLAGILSHLILLILLFYKVLMRAQTHTEARLNRESGEMFFCLTSCSVLNALLTKILSSSWKWFAVKVNTHPDMHTHCFPRVVTLLNHGEACSCHHRGLTSATSLSLSPFLAFPSVFLALSSLFLCLHPLSSLLCKGHMLKELLVYSYVSSNPLAWGGGVGRPIPLKTTNQCRSVQRRG